MKPTLLGCALLAALLAVAAPASAAGPQPLGAEREILYKGRTGALEVRVLPNGRVTWLEVNALWSCPTMKRVKPFLADGKPRIDKARRLRAGDRYDKSRWSLRFSPDWTRVTGTFTAAANGCRAPKLHLSGKRVPPARRWEAGRYSGTTSQGLPIAFTVGWAVRYDAITYFVKAATLTARFTCDDGSTTERTLKSSDEGYVSSNDGSLMASVSETGDRNPPPGTADAMLQGALEGRTATGDITGEISEAAGRCELSGATFTISRAGT
jgi:hypothetical protein